MEFLLFLSFLFFLGILEIFDWTNEKYLAYFLSFIVFCLFSGLKYDVGTDYSTYRYYYNNSMNWSIMNANGVEIGYIYIMQLFKNLSIGFVGFWFILSFVNFCFKYYIFHKYSPLLFASLLLYFVGMFLERDFDGIRQGFAMGVCYLTIPFIMRRQFLPFLLLVLLAATIHASSLVFLPAYYLVSFNISNKVIFISVSVLALMVMLNISFTQTMVNFLPESIIKMRLNSYMSVADSQYTKKVGLSIGLIFRIGILFIYTSIYKKDSIKDEKLYIFLRNGFFLGIVLSLIFNDFDILSHRLSYIYREFQIFIVPILISICRTRKMKLILLTGLFLYGIVLLYRYLHTDSLKDYYDYKNFLFQ